MSSDRRTRSLDERPPQSQATTSAPRSLDGVVLGTYPHEVIQRAYADLYASSYGSSDSEPNSDAEMETRPPAQSFGSPPMEAKVLRFQSAAPRMPAVRVGAARLSEMMMYNRRSQQPDDAGSSAVANEIKTQNTADHQSIAGPAPDQPFADGMFSGFEPDSVEARSVANNDEYEPQTPRSRRSLSTPVPLPPAPTLHADPHAVPLQLPNDLRAGIDDYNGLVAPGAMADEKQKSKADGKTPFHAFLQLLRNNDSRAQEEARLFKPTVLSTSKA
ncbi:hypothetical protein IWW45_009114, partial [Coemansia sp. RSA 485]